MFQLRHATLFTLKQCSGRAQRAEGEMGTAITSAHIQFAKRLAIRFFHEYAKGCVEFLDLQATAMLGLCEAANRFEAERGLCFSTFSYLRIRGAMFDLLRQELGRSNVASGSPDADADRKTECQLFLFKQRPHRAQRHSVYIEPLGYRVHGVKPITRRAQLSYADQKPTDEICHLRRLNRRLKSLLAGLSPLQRQLMQFYYYEGKTLDEIGELMGGYSKHWASRHHSAIIASLRASFFANRLKTGFLDGEERKAA